MPNSDGTQTYIDLFFIPDSFVASYTLSVSIEADDVKTEGMHIPVYPKENPEQ